MDSESGSETLYRIGTERTVILFKFDPDVTVTYAGTFYSCNKTCNGFLSVSDRFLISVPFCPPPLSFRGL